MMDHAAAFLRAIREAPDDDTPRLVFADWLEERGDPRGEFIRAQCRLARMPDDDPARLDVEDHAHELLARHGDDWAAPLHGVAEGWEFRRGFIERVTLNGQAFLARAERLFAAEPIRHVHMSLRPEDATALAARPELRWLETLAFERCHLRDKAFQAILGSPYLTRLTALVVPAGVEVPGVQALIETGILARLIELDLSHNPAFGDRAALLLLTAPSVRALQVLRVGGTNLSPAGVLNVLFSPILTHLTALDVAGVERAAGPGDFTPVLLQMAANSRFLARLTSLDLSYRGLHGSGLEALMGSPDLAYLRELHLRRTRLDLSALRALAESSYLAGLTVLDLDGNNIRAEGSQALTESPHLANLTALRLGHNALRDTGAKALANSPYLKRLTALDLRYNGIGGPGLHALAASENLARLTDLNLSGNFVGLASVAGNRPIAPPHPAGPPGPEQHALRAGRRPRAGGIAEPRPAAHPLPFR
jgi:uncharacterized protein (TIGR02996 family)